MSPLSASHVTLDRLRRIEVNEIEATLSKHPGIGYAVVNKHPKKEQLVAYCTPPKKEDSTPKLADSDLGEVDAWGSIYDEVATTSFFCTGPKSHSL